MTGYGRGESVSNGKKFTVELNSVNRKQSEVAVNLPRELAEAEPRIRDLINAQISRGRLNVVVAFHNSTGVATKPALDLEAARAYHRAMLDLQKELGVNGDIGIETVLRAPGVLRAPEEKSISVEEATFMILKSSADAKSSSFFVRDQLGSSAAPFEICHLPPGPGNGRT